MPENQQSKASRQKAALALELQNAYSDMKLLQDEIRKRDMQIILLRHNGNTLEKNNAELRGKNFVLEQKVQILECVLEETSIPRILDLFEAFQQAVSDCVDCLSTALVFRPPDAFNSELLGARDRIRPWIGDALLETLVERSREKGKPLSEFIIRLASHTLILTHLTSETIRLTVITKFTVSQDIPRQKALLLEAFASMFKIASWSLPTAHARRCFEGSLGKVLIVHKQISGSETQQTMQSKKIHLISAAFGPVTEPDEIKAVNDVNGREIPVITGSSEVLGFLSWGLQVTPASHETPIVENSEQHRTITRANVVLKSTLQAMIQKECQSSPKRKSKLIAVVEGDGRD